MNIIQNFNLIHLIKLLKMFYIIYLYTSVIFYLIKNKIIKEKNI